MKFATINPATNTLEKEYEFATKEEITAKIDQAYAAFKNWSGLSFEARAAKAGKLAEILEERAEEYGKIIQIEMGKPLAEAIGECKKSAGLVRYFAEKAEEFMKPC